ncbi:MAG: helix-turn-helix domain-containing protein [Planctomycetota bacterium]|jgi:excisionase family DNA binding protein
MKRKSQKEPDPFLTVREACQLASISRSTFYRLLDTPDSGLADIAVRIPGMGHIRLPRQAFLDWLCSAPLSSGGKKGTKTC